jgi:hypothetical protein
MLADALASHFPHIVVARLNCSGQAEAFCERAIGVTRTPSFKVSEWWCGWGRACGARPFLAETQKKNPEKKKNARLA